jgi:hypothetical protein
VPSKEPEPQYLEDSAADHEEPSVGPRPVILRVAIESKLGLWPSETKVELRRVAEPVAAKRARRRRG